MENFLQKIKSKQNPVSGNAVSPKAVAFINMLKGSAKQGNVNQDIYNPQGYTGTNGYNGDYAALLSDQIKNALGNTGLYEQVMGSSYDQMAAQNSASDSIYNNRKAETGGLAQKEYQNQMSGYGSNPLNVVGQKTLSSIDEATKTIMDTPQFKSANLWSQAYTNMKPSLAEIIKVPDNKAIDTKQANAMIEAYGQAVTGGGLTQGLYDANGNLSKNVLTDLQKYSSYVIPKDISSSNMTAGVAKAMAKATIANARAYSQQVQKNYDLTFGSNSAITNLVNTSSKGQLTVDQIPSVSSLKGAMSGFIK